MSTSKQIAANRRNAEKSTGPKTAEGREIVSRNAITHGLTAARAVVLPEEQEEFDRFFAAMREEWDPQGPLEQFHLERLVQCAWRLKRMAQIETSTVLALSRKERTVQNDSAALGRAYVKGGDVLAKLSRHERQIERSVRAAQFELELASYSRATLFHPFYARNQRNFPEPSVFRPRERGQSKPKGVQP